MNVRVILAGVFLIVFGLGFFFYMMETLMPRSNDPAGMMQTVGEVSGFVGALGLVFIVFGVFKKKRQP
jgi:hypothetical protein